MVEIEIIMLRVQKHNTYIHKPGIERLVPRNLIHSQNPKKLVLQKLQIEQWLPATEREGGEEMLISGLRLNRNKRPCMMLCSRVTIGDHNVCTFQEARIKYVESFHHIKINICRDNIINLV